MRLMPRPAVTLLLPAGADAGGRVHRGLPVQDRQVQLEHHAQHDAGHRGRGHCQLRCAWGCVVVEGAACLVQWSARLGVFSLEWTTPLAPHARLRCCPLPCSLCPPALLPPPLLPMPACTAAHLPRRSRPPALATPPGSPPPAGELNFNIVGVLFQLGSIFSESIRLVMVQILLQVSSAPSCTAAVHVPAAVANSFAARVLNHCGVVAGRLQPGCLPRRGVHNRVQALQQYRLLGRHGAALRRTRCFALCAVAWDWALWPLQCRAGPALLGPRCLLVSTCPNKPRTLGCPAVPRPQAQPGDHAVLCGALLLLLPAGEGLGHCAMLTPIILCSQL